jgi:hypothetical protein
MKNEDAQSDRDDSIPGSDATDNTVSTTIGSIIFRDKSILKIDVHKDDETGTVSARIKEQRFKTSLGETQGDHVIPYRFILELIAKTMTGNSINEIPRILDATFRSIFPIMQEKRCPDLPRKYIKPKPRILRKLADDYETIEIYKEGVRGRRLREVENYVKTLVEAHSLAPDVVHVKTGKKGTDEGDNIHASLIAFNAINEFMTIVQEMPEDHAKQEEFMKECIATNGKFVDGMSLIFPEMKDDTGKVNISSIRLKFGLPKDAKFNDSKFQQSYSDFFNKMNASVNNLDIMSSIIEIPFDFPKTQYVYSKKKEKKPTAMTEEQLAQHASSYISVLSHCFPKIGFSKPLPDIITGFLRIVKDRQGWEDSDMRILESVEVSDYIREFINTTQPENKKSFLDQNKWTTNSQPEKKRKFEVEESTLKPSPSKLPSATIQNKHIRFDEGGNILLGNLTSLVKNQNTTTHSIQH